MKLFTKLFLSIILSAGFSQSMQAQVWTTQTSGTSNQLNGVYFISSTQGWVVGASGTILTTSNGGTTWTAQTSGTSNNLNSVYFTSSTQGWAVGASGTILTTSNGGTTWTAQTGNGRDYSSVYFTSATQGWVVGAFGTILTTINGGTTWSVQASGTFNDLYSIYFSSASQGWVVGSSGTILTTSNGGTSWTTQTSGTGQELYSVFFTSATQGWVAGRNGTIITTNNGGTSWTSQTPSIAATFTGIYFTSATQGWVVGYAGTINTTINGGTTWTTQTSGISSALLGLNFISATQGYAVAFNGSIIKDGPFPPPTITSFTPSNAKPGDAVTITGTNFNGTKANNIVFFGSTKANVTAATATSLTVTVPNGATYGPITELNTGTQLACYSLKNFNPIYSPAKTNISTADFATKVDFTAGTAPASFAVGDLDGDGLPDLVVANRAANSISIFRNTASSGSITTGSFASPVTFATGAAPSAVAIGDLDGDGKPDLAVVNYSENTVSVFRNTVTSGISSSSFAAKVNFTTGLNPNAVAIGDLDGDGKLDLAVANHNAASSASVSVFRNTATSGSITTGSFATKVDFSAGNQIMSITIGDIDGDGKLDLVSANYLDNTVSVLRNTATSGTITSSSFAENIDFATGTGPYSVAIGDLDADGKPDLVVANRTAATVSVLRNTVTSGISSSSFAAKVDFATGSNPVSVAIGDLDADSKPDFVVGNYNSNTVSIFRNTATSGSIAIGSFATKVDFTTSSGPSAVSIGDLDGDGMPDLATPNINDNNVSVLRNIIVINALDKLSLTSATPSSGAYSLRKLSTSYSGNAILVRRSSDNTTQAIGFTVGGDLDTASLKTFVSTGNGYVATWYDQGGKGYDAVQATTASQPRIVAAGVVERLNGKPAVNFLGAQSLSMPSSVIVAGSNPSTLNCVAQLNNNTGWQWVVGYGSASSAAGRGLGSTSTNLVDMTLYGVDIQGVNSNTQFIATGNFNNTPSAALASQNINPTGTASSFLLANSPNTGNNAAIIGAKVNNTEFWNGYIQEITLYNSTLFSADMTSVQNSQITYYSGPYITASTAVSSALSTSAGTASSTANFTVSGVYMLAGILVTAPTGYEVSTSASGPFSSSVTVGAAGTIASTTVYIRLASSTATGFYNGTIALTSTGAPTANVLVGGTVLYTPPAITYGVTGTQVYSPGTAITQLTLTNTGGAVLAKGANVLSIFGLGGINANNGLDGPASSATFNSPSGLAVDTSGNVYVADQANYKLRKITAGSVSTFAGTGSGGSTDGPVASAKFNYPTGVVIDASGNVFVADHNNNSLRKVSAGVVSTIASFAYADAVAVDAAGNLYVADSYNHKIYKITAAGIMSTLAGSGSPGAVDATGAAASFNHPAGIAVDAIGNVYVADANNNKIRQITAAGVVSTFAGSGTRGETDGTGTAALFTSPTGLAIDAAGNLYVADFANGAGTIRKITPTAVVTTISKNWQYPQAVAVDNAFNVYWALGSGNAGNQILSLSQQGYSISPALPAGLSFDSTNGKISGTPTGYSPATNYTITATNAGGSSTTTLSIQITGSITVGTVSGTMTTCVGSPSVSPKIQQFSVSGAFLTDNILVTAPANFEVSLAAGSGYGGTVTLNQSSGTVNSTTVYVRLAANATAGNKADSVVLTSAGGVTTQKVGVAGTVYQYPVLNPIQGTKSVCVGNQTTLTAIAPASVPTDTLHTANPKTLSVSTNTALVTADQTMGSVAPLPLFLPLKVWSSDNLAVATVDANTGVVTGVSAGTATITCSLSGLSTCVSTQTAVVTVNPLPVLAAITGSSTVLVNSTSPLANTTAGGTWSSSNTAAATIDASTGVVSGIVAGTTTITYAYTNSNGCSSSINTLITVVAIAPITGTTNVCAGSTTTLADATPNGSWSSSDVTKATIDAAGKVTGIAAGNITISYSITGIGTVTTAFTVNALPTGNIAAAAGSIICGTGGSIVLTASGGNSYAWTKGGTAITGITANQLTVTVPAVYTATVTNTTTGCSAAAGNSITVTQLFAPKASFVNDSYCVNKPITLTNQSTVGTSGPVNYAWSDNNGNSSSGSNAAFTYSSVGAYSIKLKVIPQACPNIADSSIRIIAVEASTAGVRYPRVDAVINNPTPLQARTFGVAYSWSPATALSNATIANPTVRIKTETDYSVQITAASGCTTIDNVLVRAFDVNLYVPNVFSPNGDGVNDVLYVNLINIKQLKFYRIYDRWGKKMFETNDPTQGWDGKWNGALQHIDTYTWVAEAVDNNGTYVTKSGTVTLLR